MDKDNEIIMLVKEFDQLQKKMDSIYNKLAKSSRTNKYSILDYIYYKK